ncbi:MAG TPA: hypothetical protein V6D03_10540 [Candidatus Caenarcaniphilales bacterium]
MSNFLQLDLQVVARFSATRLVQEKPQAVRTGAFSILLTLAEVGVVVERLNWQF